MMQHASFSNPIIQWAKGSRNPMMQHAPIMQQVPYSCNPIIQLARDSFNPMIQWALDSNPTIPRAPVSNPIIQSSLVS